jgi:hypothetical protein
MGVLPTPDTPATQVKFFKIDDPSYDAATGVSSELYLD